MQNFNYYKIQCGDLEGACCTINHENNDQYELCIDSFGFGKRFNVAPRYIYHNDYMHEHAVLSSRIKLINRKFTQEYIGHVVSEMSPEEYIRCKQQYLDITYDPERQLSSYEAMLKRNEEHQTSRRHSYEITDDRSGKTTRINV